MGTRTKENIVYLRHVVLDFENGELQPQTLPELFPDIQMVVTNTYNHTSDKPRFRAVLFTDEPMTDEEQNSLPKGGVRRRVTPP